jgi:excisionase family DNA binding protein
MPQQNIKPLAVRRRVAAAMLGIGTTTLDEKIATGQIRAVKSGKCMLVLTESIEGYLASLPAAKLKSPERFRKQTTAAATPSAPVKRGGVSTVGGRR